ncbi:medium-chain fatty acid-CoA ligase faa2 [Coemansia spiralis]|uniref:Medium-chain fatty acid-CoA ligase faa2 n=2 Tax=Coemansia TaxID=4863 RepID=A0A9W8KWY6_9FUNG|nr:medium-chain fatty acid-CoA ligase faa2 [Coemansia umbellata]KAJ2621061.1 medium-chain fatty acid-CoA ligase faa2 [Coemansia sp. RSA 1358]KAJ2673794.1 medium-chain fatty acid-CoA ligase faa2 [Coemansia spiralis]
MQSYKVPSSEAPGYSYVLRHPDFKDGTCGTEFNNITTLWELFRWEVVEFSKNEFLGTRSFNPRTGKFGEYSWITTTDASEIVDNLGSGLDQVYAKYAPMVPDATPGQQPMAIFSNNRAEWILAEFAAFRSRRYSVGISDQLGVDYAENTINHAECAVIVCSMDKIPRMLDRMSMTPGVKVIVSMDKLDCSEQNTYTQAFNREIAANWRLRAESMGVVLLDMAQVVEIGRAQPTHASPPTPEDICTITYTSGTTSAQKGVMRTHDSNVAASKSIYLALRPRNTTYLSFIPLMFCFDRYAIYAMMFEHARIGMYSGNPANLLDDMKTLRPAIIISLPWLLNKLYEPIAASTIKAGGLVGMLSRFAYKQKLKRVAAGKGFKHALWDRLIFNKVAQVFGGRIEMLSTGGGAIDPAVQAFFSVTLSCEVLHGYGQTENFANGTMQVKGYPTSAGHSGIPVPGADLQLRNVPEMEYLVTDSPCPRGELMIRSRSGFSGYLKEPELTNLVKVSDWVATGDIAQFNADGTISIIDRMKHIIKTGRSFFIAPDLLENIYSKHQLVKDIFIHGSVKERELVAIIVPDKERFISWARGFVDNADNVGFEELCANKDVTQALVKELKLHASLNNLMYQEQICAVHCDPIPFEKNSHGFYTSTYKLRRTAVLNHYKPQFAKLFVDADSTIKLDV